MQFIPHARVPVLQYVGNRFGIFCDIWIDNFVGRIKSKIFYWINTLDERFGDMVLLVWSSYSRVFAATVFVGNLNVQHHLSFQIKEWAKAQNINDPKSGSLNSYSLCLLVLFHFQVLFLVLKYFSMRSYSFMVLLNSLLILMLFILDFLDIRATNSTTSEWDLWREHYRRCYRLNEIFFMSGDCLECQYLVFNSIHSHAEAALYNDQHLDEVCAANIARFRLQNKGWRNESSICRLLGTFFQKVLNIEIPLLMTETFCDYCGYYLLLFASW